MKSRLTSSKAAWLALFVIAGMQLHGCSTQTANLPSSEHDSLGSALESARKAIDHGHLEEAQITLKRVSLNLSSAESEQVLDVWLTLAAAYQDMGKFAVAGPVLENALEIAKSQKNAKRQTDILQRLKALSQQEKAEHTLLEAEIEASDKERHKTGRAFRERVQKLQAKYAHSTNYQEAASALEPCLPEAKELRRKSVNEIQLVMHVLEDLYTRFQKYDRCAAMYEEHLKTIPKQLDGLETGDFKSIDNARDMIEDLAGIVRMRTYQKRFAEAEEYATRGLKLCNDVYGPESSQSALRYHELGNLLVNLNRPDEAVDPFKREAEIYTKHDEKHARVSALLSLAKAYNSAYRYRETKATLKKILGSMRPAQAPLLYAQAQSLLCITLLKLHELKDADALNQEVLKRLKEQEQHKYLIQHLIEWQQSCIFVPERLSQVFTTASLIKSASSQDKMSPEVMLRLFNSDYYCVKAKVQLSQLDQAIADLKKLDSAYPSKDPYCQRIVANELANCYRFKGDLKTAEMFYRKAVNNQLDEASKSASKNAMAWCLIELGKNREAKTVFNSVQLPAGSIASRTMIELSRNAGMVVLLKDDGEESKAKELLQSSIKKLDDFVGGCEGVDASAISWRVSMAAGSIEGFSGEQRRIAKIAFEMSEKYLAKSPLHKKIADYNNELSR